jgi:hypothetical protein
MTYQATGGPSLSPRDISLASRHVFNQHNQEHDSNHVQISGDSALSPQDIFSEFPRVFYQDEQNYDSNTVQASGGPSTSPGNIPLDLTDFNQVDQENGFNPVQAYGGPQSSLQDTSLSSAYISEQVETKHSNTILHANRVDGFLLFEELRTEPDEEEREYYLDSIDTAAPQVPVFSTSDVLEPALPNSLSLLPSRRTKPSVAVDRSLPRFPCPIFQDEVKRSLPHTCNGGGGNTMSELRTHMIRGTKGRPPHLEFLKRCRTCNKDIIDRTEYNNNHDSKCPDSHPIRKGEAANKQYQMLCAIVVPTTTTDSMDSPCKYMQSIVLVKLIMPLGGLWQSCDRVPGEVISMQDV